MAKTKLKNNFNKVCKQRNCEYCEHQSDRGCASANSDFGFIIFRRQESCGDESNNLVYKIGNKIRSENQ